MSTNEYTNCRSCTERADYSQLKNTTNYTCDQPCLCRWTGERSDKDKMYYNWFVLGKPMVLTGKDGIINVQKGGNCK